MARIAWLAAAAGLASPGARADVRTAIDVTSLQVSVAAIAPGRAPAVSFAGAGGSTSTCEVIVGQPSSDSVVTSGSAMAFGAVSGALEGDPRAGATAMLGGDIFGGGGAAHASAHASSSGPAAMSQGTLGLANGVAATRFTLAPGTRLTITANVTATAFVSGSSAFEIGDSGLEMRITDAEGTGPQFTRVLFDAFALGAFGPDEVVETTFVSLVYDNATDTDITGLFSGYVAAFASTGDPASPVPEPASGAAMLVGIALLAALRLGGWRAAPQ